MTTGLILAVYGLFATSFGVAILETQSLKAFGRFKIIALLIFSATWPFWVAVELFAWLLT